ncbi:MAG: hypothetical protein B7Y43_12405 [Sphingomonas sp. 28-62-20]|nr:MAG: hypothetical protein B7Y43_12405 [Sphingomonas sp. 28-62-20]
MRTKLTRPPGCASRAPYSADGFGLEQSKYGSKRRPFGLSEVEAQALRMPFDFAQGERRFLVNEL